MKLEHIITLASPEVELQCRVMERSLRGTGCTLPLLVIPYNEGRFALPQNAHWLEDGDLFAWLKVSKVSGVYRKYLCLTRSHYLFVDTDIVFLRNPSAVLASMEGFITSCGHWKNTAHTTTTASKQLLQNISTNWQYRVFNTGQFASEQALFSFETLKIMAEENRFTCLNHSFHEQPGINLLVNLSGINITNLTLPPYKMESTWAGDYPNEDFSKTWQTEETMPWLIHWAGRKVNQLFSIDDLFFNYLTEEEKANWRLLPAGRTSILQSIKAKLLR